MLTNIPFTSLGLDRRTTGVRGTCRRYWDCRLKKFFVPFSVKIMANLYRKKSCLHLGDMAFSPVQR
jgi:hypothetical protein